MSNKTQVLSNLHLYFHAFFNLNFKMWPSEVVNSCIHARLVIQLLMRGEHQAVVCSNLHQRAASAAIYSLQTLVWCLCPLLKQNMRKASHYLKHWAFCHITWPVATPSGHRPLMFHLFHLSIYILQVMNFRDALASWSRFCSSRDNVQHVRINGVK